MGRKPSNIIHYTKEIVFNPESKGLFITDLRFVPSLEVSSLIDAFELKNVNYIILQENEDEYNYFLPSHVKDQLSSIDLSDLNPTISALLGTGISLNNQGLLQVQILQEL